MLSRYKYPKDLTNMSIGSLFISGLAYIKDSRQYYDCVCDCGNHTIKSRSYLTSDIQHKSCGCQRNKRPRQKPENHYEICDDCIIGYTNNTNTPFYFDKQFFDKVRKYRWRETAKGYICASTLVEDEYTTRSILLHQVILGQFDYSIKIDHENHNKADNRLSNLRIYNVMNNGRNRKIASNNKTGVTGVCMRKNRYRAFIYNKGKCIELGVYDTLEEAKEKRLEAEYIYFGEFRNKENEM